MKQPTVFIAFAATGLILALVLTGLAVYSHERELCGNAANESAACQVVANGMAFTPSLSSGDQPTPTLAPPRPATSEPNVPYSNELAKGQPVFLKVETDHNEIEVGWATP